jgi:hypothetical protein
MLQALLTNGKRIMVAKNLKLFALFFFVIGSILYILPRYMIGKSIIWADNERIKQAMADTVVIKLIHQLNGNVCFGFVYPEDICDAITLRLRTLGLYSVLFLTTEDITEAYHQNAQIGESNLHREYVNCLASGKDNCLG